MFVSLHYTSQVFVLVGTIQHNLFIYLSYAFIISRCFNLFPVESVNFLG